MKTQEQIKKEVTTYLQKTSNHLFERDGELMKVIYFTEDNQENYAIVKIKGEEISIQVEKAWPGQIYSQRKFFLKHHYVFRSWDPKKWKSVKHFKKIRVFFDHLTREISSDSNKNLELIARLKKFAPLQ
jgi:hypothetical protein